MKTNQTTRKTGWASLPAPQCNTPATLTSRVTLLGCVALLLAAVNPAMAQTTNITDIYTPTATTVSATVNGVTLTSYETDKARLTVGNSETNSAATALRVNLGGGAATLVSSTTNFIDPDYYITNYYDLDPAVATLAATGVPAGAEVVFGSQSVTNSTPNNANLDSTVTFNYTNLISGDYDMAVEATSANTWRYPLPVKAGSLWSGLAGTSLYTTNNPGATNETIVTNVVYYFNNPGNWVGGVVPGASDIVILDNAAATGSSSTPTLSITNDTTIGSVSDIHINSDFVHWSIPGGTTLSILGDNGYRVLGDYIDENERSRFLASGAGTMVVSNANAEFNIFQTRQNDGQSFYMDFQNLNTLILDVQKISFNDIGAYPNFGTNGNTSRPRRNIYRANFAITNLWRATQTDANNWTNNARDYSLVLARQINNGQTGNDSGFHFGLHNELYMDSMLWGGQGQMENPEIDFLNTGSYMKIRNADGVSRMSNLTIADAGDPQNTGTTTGGATKIDVSLTRGTVDALIETLIIGRDPLITGNGPANGKLFLGPGTFDVNNAFLGYQTDNTGGTEDGSATGRVDVNDGSIFVVNNTLSLGHTETNLSTVTGGGGVLIVNSGGTALVNNITVGGPANASTANSIDVNSGGELVVSNAIGTASAPVQTLAVDGTLTINANPTVTNVFATTISAGNGVIKVLSLTGVSSYPATIPVLNYANPTAAAFSLDLSPLGAGFYGYVLNDGVGLINAVITTNAPKTLVWDGGTGVWDHFAPNWQGGQVFTDGDTVIFDDSAAGTTTVSISGTVVVGSGGVLVSNITKAYTLGGGSVLGSATMTKDGTGSLTVDATSGLQLDQIAGTVNVGATGKVGPVNGSTNTVLNNEGITGKVVSSGEVNNTGFSAVMNGLDLQSGGTITNSSGGTISGAFEMRGGSTGLIAAGSTVEQGVIRARVYENAWLELNGQWNNNTDRLEVRGTLTGSGTVSDLSGSPGTGRLQFPQTTSVFAPAGSNTIGTFMVEGRLDLERRPARIVIDVDLANPATNDVIACDSFNNIRGYLEMNNIGATPFAAGQTFTIYTINFGLYPNPWENNDQFTMDPVVPGVGLQWDTSAFFTNGILSVVSAPATPPALTSSSDGSTLSLSWPSTHIGYQLQVQTNNLDAGISTNWYPLVGTEGLTSTNIPIDQVNPSVFFRLSNQ